VRAIDADLGSSLRALIEKEAIEQTLLRYASSIDVKDWETLGNTFCADGAATLASGEVLRGRDVILDYIRTATAGRAWQHHLINVYHVDIDGDEASALTYHTSHQVAAEDPDRALVLVARYHDRLRREADGAWRISEKVLEVGWREERSRR